MITYVTGIELDIQSTVSRKNMMIFESLSGAQRGNLRFVILLLLSHCHNFA